MISPIMHDPDLYVSTEPEAVLGQLFYHPEGAIYRYGQAVDVTATVGFVVEYTATPGVYTADRAGGSSLGRRTAGVAAFTIPADSYGYFQVSGAGRHALLTDGGIAAGDPIIGHATTNGGIDTGTIGTDDGVQFGTALVADTGTVLAAGEYMIHGIL